MSLQSRLSRRIENARKRDTNKRLMLSPEKEQCPSCGRSVVSGPMGLSRHFSNFPQCSLDFYRDPILLSDRVSYSSVHGQTMINAPDGNHCHSASMSLADGNQYNYSPDIDNSFRKSSDFFVADGFDETNDNAAGKHSVPRMILLEVQKQTLIFLRRIPMNLLQMFPSFMVFPLESEVNGGLDGALFSLEEEVQVDLLRTLQRLKCPMIAYDEVMKWAVRSCSRGHTFHDLPISSQNCCRQVT
ncbi:hypothetical protein MHU86_20376 [Fragilaria crotonensis]|nr:hypothetical protein MHU86_20376 [Fragilaria crotonensis]